MYKGVIEEAEGNIHQEIRPRNAFICMFLLWNQNILTALASCRYSDGVLVAWRSVFVFVATMTRVSACIYLHLLLNWAWHCCVTHCNSLQSVSQNGKSVIVRFEVLPEVTGLTPSSSDKARHFGATHRLHLSFLSGLFFYAEDRDNVFFRNVSVSPNHTGYS